MKCVVVVAFVDLAIIAMAHMHDKSNVNRCRRHFCFSFIFHSNGEEDWRISNTQFFVVVAVYNLLSFLFRTTLINIQCRSALVRDIALTLSRSIQTICDSMCHSNTFPFHRRQNAKVRNLIMCTL